MPTGEAASRAAVQSGDKKDRNGKHLGPGSVSGNLTRDPELRYTPSGKAVAAVSVAYNPRIRNEQTGEWSDGPAEYYEIQAWGQLAENIVAFLGRGDRVVAEGAWTEQTWTDNEDVTRTKVVMVAKDLGPSLAYRGAVVERRPRQEGSS